MTRITLPAALLTLALAGCGPQKPTYIDDPRSHMPAPGPVVGNPVWNNAATGFAESLYFSYLRGGHADLAQSASASLIDAMREGRMPPLDPLCDCTSLDHIIINAQTQEARPGLSAKVMVAVTNGGHVSSIYLYLAMTPLGFKIDDIATPSLRQGLFNYLRNNRKTEDEIQAERQAALERGECPSLEEC